MFVSFRKMNETRVSLIKRVSDPQRQHSLGKALWGILEDALTPALSALGSG